ncbi:hypothetical protein DKL61_10970 [Gammaproteobacteria bacterium ESL0073]|nr:hypothetical protein DKL61_10970 [Gammaproteobacteria bacterium ESL0073]
MKKNFKTQAINLFVLSLTFYSLLSYSAETPKAGLDCTKRFSESCNQNFKPKATIKNMHYYSSLLMESKEKPTSALIVIHGFKHTAKEVFNVGLKATKKADRLHDTVIIAPIFYADEMTPNYKHCMKDDSPVGDRKKDLVWSCQGWMEGAMAENDKNIGAFDILDQLINELHKKWPSIKDITIAGFSAGGQTIQRYIGYAQPNKNVNVRYVIADPGSWFYFDPERPVLQKNKKPAEWQTCIDDDMKNCDFKMEIPDKQACPNYNAWKYGNQNMPTHLKRSLHKVKSAYAKADIYYLEGALDSNSGKGTAYKLLDKSCAAKLQGPYRMQRGLSFAAYDRALIAPEKKRTVTIVPNCKHDVSCVFSSDEAQSILFKK